MFHQGFSLKKIEDGARLLIPYLLLVLLMVLSAVRLPFLPVDVVKPPLVLMAVYYWAIYRPTLLPASLCFFAGVLTDILGGTPLGINAFIMVLTYWIVRDQRRFLRGQSYGTIWAIFGFVAILSSLIQWGLYGLAHFRWDMPLSTLEGAVTGVFLFPFVTLLLVATHRILPVSSHRYG